MKTSLQRASGSRFRLQDFMSFRRLCLQQHSKRTQNKCLSTNDTQSAHKTDGLSVQALLGFGTIASPRITAASKGDHQIGHYRNIYGHKQLSLR